MLMYISDQAGEAMEKKSQVSHWTRIYLILLVTPEVAILQSIQRELITCARLHHGSIMPVYGYTYGFGQLMAIVSPWAENGNLTTYLQREHDLTVVRRFRLVSDHLLCMWTGD
jgi:hypothetical protein